MKKLNSFGLTAVDKSYLEWSVSRNSLGTAGSFLKSYEEIDGRQYYYKASNYDSVRGFYGHESLNEIVTYNLASGMKMDCLKYDLIYGYVQVPGRDRTATLFTCSEDFKHRGEHKLTFETFYDVNKLQGETTLDFINRMGLQSYFYDMFLLDWLICNRDRHGANVEVLVSDNSFRMAPLFDNGLSFAFSCYNFEGIQKFDIRKDSPVNNFIGSCILSDNLKLVPNSVRSKIDLIDYDKLFVGLDQYEEMIPQEYFDTIREMIKVRVEHVKTV